MVLQGYKYFPGVALVMLLIALGAQTNSAVEEFRSLQTELRNSHKSGDWQSFLAGAKRQKALLNEAPDSLLEVARAEVHVGDLKAAFQNLDQFARMGQSTDLLATLPDFFPLRSQASFAGIQAKMKSNRSPISLASTALQLSDPGLLAEDVDYDPNTRRFFITSVREKKILFTDLSGSSSDFAKAPDDWPMVAVKVDSARGLVWATEVAMQGLIFFARV
jgi:hypothetical protein